MKKNTPEIFIQTRNTTCGVSCLMMILNALGKPVALTKGTEGKLFRSLKAHGYELVPAIGLATHARKQGLFVSAVIDGGPYKFFEYWRNADHDMYLQQMSAYETARKTGVVLKNHSVTVSTMKESLSAGNLLIAGIDLGGGIKHAVVVFDHKDGTFSLIDPLTGKTEVPEKKLLRQMHMELGTWYIEIQ